MDRQALLGQVKLVAPALGGGRALLPITSHLCFDGENLTAYDEIIALRTKCDFDFQGCVPGAELMAILSSSSAKEVSCEQTGDSEVTFKVGRTRAKFSFLPLEDFRFTVPKTKGGTEIDLNDALMTSFRGVASSGGKDSAFPTRLGITCAWGKRRIELYATDSVTMSWARTKLKLDQFESFIILPRFYDIMVAQKFAKMIVTPKGHLVCRSDDVSLYGRALSEVDTGQFKTLFQIISEEDIVFGEVSDTFWQCLERAVIVDPMSTEFSYAEGRLKLTTRSRGAEVKDVIKIDLGDREIKVVGSSELILRFRNFTNQFGLCSKLMSLKGEEFVSCVGVD